MTKAVNGKDGGHPAGSVENPIVIKKYANRRLYNTDSSSYVTLEDLGEMVKAGKEFLVCDAKTGDDITRTILTQIIFEAEGKEGQTLLPISFLRQLISFYGDQVHHLTLPHYLEMSMTSFQENQKQLRKMVEENMPTMFPVANFESLGQQQMAMMEQAMKLFNPLSGFNPQNSGEPPKDSAQQSPESSEQSIETMKQQLEAMQQQLERLSRS